MKELKGQIASMSGISLGSVPFLTGIGADQCNSSSHATGICHSVCKPFSNP
ncbi:hypothetical protein [Phyllobacterium sophorae]|uniref:hypothetical protein n=1 Tax=Phyllobacterium sophorae TaxID=1520277 RepID=UPI0014750FF7|nr:hypothetical protein [Phyllobacterium sophorae]